uniref:Uncharacterized protein n=1 Tax=Sphaerodactylus townsendi TaxID=933632 RepID=A0ACB8F453_9SAUR
MAIDNRIVFPKVDATSNDATWNILHDSITTAAKLTLSTKKSGHWHLDKQTWLWTEEVQQKFREKKVAFKAWFANKTGNNWQYYTAARWEAKRIVATAQAEYHQKLYEQLDMWEGLELSSLFHLSDLLMHILIMVAFVILTGKFIPGCSSSADQRIL